MKLADLIDRLVEIHNSEKEYNPEVSIMTEAEIDGCRPYQFQHKVSDIAVSDRSGVIIIGQELE